MQQSIYCKSKMIQSQYSVYSKQYMMKVEELRWKSLLNIFSSAEYKIKKTEVKVKDKKMSLFLQERFFTLIAKQVWVQ